LLAFFAALALAAHGLRAQGGPPMITDDPGTPGDKHWEINVAWTEQEMRGSTLVGLPLLDANYGVGDRLQLNYQASWNVLRTSGAESTSGMSDSQLAVKWRFYDAGEDGLKISMFPRFSFLDPGSDSDRRGTAESSPAFLLPFEVLKDFGSFSVNADLGHIFSADADERGWTYGLCVGRNVTKHWELDAEVHFNSSDRLQENETIVNVGTRYDLSENVTVLLAIGKDTNNSLGPLITLLSYVGVQIRL
jgi:hypothetical protein